MSLVEWRNPIALGASFGVCIGEMKALEFLTAKGLISRDVSRKWVRFSLRSALSPFERPLLILSARMSFPDLRHHFLLFLLHIQLHTFLRAAAASLFGTDANLASELKSLHGGFLFEFFYACIPFIMPISYLHLC